MLGVLVLDLPQFTDARGMLVAFEAGSSLPFEVKRCFFMWGVPPDVSRGGDALSAHEALIAIKGRVTIEVDNGREVRHFVMNRPTRALCIHAGVWMRLYDFSPDAVVLAIASRAHSETQRSTQRPPKTFSAPDATPWCP